MAVKRVVLCKNDVYSALGDVLNNSFVKKIKRQSTNQNLQLLQRTYIKFVDKSMNPERDILEIMWN